MSEGIVHSLLVLALVKQIEERLGPSDIVVWADTPVDGRYAATPTMGGLRPDVYARRKETGTVILGEAKSARDIDTPHTRSQLRKFFEDLSSEVDGLLWIAVPLSGAGSAMRIARSVRLDSRCERVPFIVSGWLLGAKNVEQRWHG